MKNRGMQIYQPHRTRIIRPQRDCKGGSEQVRAADINREYMEYDLVGHIPMNELIKAEQT